MHRLRTQFVGTDLRASIRNRFHHTIHGPSNAKTTSTDGKDAKAWPSTRVAPTYQSSG